MSQALQAKLLRVLQEREFEPLGSERTQKIDVRVIAATNRDLRQMVGDGRFQEDLFYRLNVIPIHIPPLRERREDIPVLVDHFVSKHAQRAGKRIDGLQPGVLATLQASDWPGNVRELENTIERAVVLSPGTLIGPDVVRMLDAGRTPPPGLPSLNLRQNIDWTERETVRRALESCRRREERCGRSHGHQPARAQLLPREASRRVITSGVSRSVGRKLQAATMAVFVRFQTNRPGTPLAPRPAHDRPKGRGLAPRVWRTARRSGMHGRGVR